MATPPGFGDVGAIAGEQIVRPQHVADDGAHGRLGQQLAPDPALVDQHPDALVDAAGFGREGFAPDAALFVGEGAPLLLGAAVFKGVAALQFRLQLVPASAVWRQLVDRRGWRL